MVPPTAIDVQAATDTQAATFYDKLSVNGVAARRSNAPAISGGLAAPASSDMFKSPASSPNARLLSGLANLLIGTRQAKSEKMESYVRIQPPASHLRGY